MRCPVTQSKFQSVLFYTFLVLFCITTIVELCAMIGIVHMEPDYEHKLFYAIVIEIAGAIVSLWKQIFDRPFIEPPMLDGDWEYECIREDGTYKHGGVCRIFVERGSFGWEFTIQGTRLWKADGNGEQWDSREILPAPLGWQSSWGTFTGNDSLRFEYTIQRAGAVIHGYGTVAVSKRQEEQATELLGNFYQLPPHDPFYGSQRFWRTDVNKKKPGPGPVRG